MFDTLNFKRETSLDGSTANTHLIERFTRAGENTLLYEFTVDDPSTWTRPWSAAIEMSKSDGLIYEYAYHETNYPMAGILSGARKRDGADGKVTREPSSTFSSIICPPTSFSFTGLRSRETRAKPKLELGTVYALHGESGVSDSGPRNSV